jgi:hypothetical protein
MTEKNTITLVLVALIGAVGVIVAACIGLIPTILPMVRPTSTFPVFAPDTFTPSSTLPLPITETASATFAPTETPTLTATLQLNETPTETQTTVPTLASSSSNVDDYEGIWLTVDKQPASDRVSLVVTRIDITKTGDTTANLSVCRQTENSEISVLPNPAPASLYDFALVARDLTIPRNPDLKWAILIQQSGDQIVATVQEYDLNNILLNSDTFRLEQPNLLESVGLDPCETPATPSP